MLRNLVLLFFLPVMATGWAQDNRIKIEAKKIPNRLAFYAINQSENDLDVKLTLKGTNFRQSKARPRFVRIPATSKVHMKTVVVVRGKQPQYTYELVVNDSLSRRALRKEYELVKIKPKKSITLYVPASCISCDSLEVRLAEGRYLYKVHKLEERQEIKDQLSRSFANSINLDSLQTPILNLGGKLFTKIESYEKLLEELAKE